MAERVFDGKRIHGQIAVIGDAIFSKWIYVQDRIPRTNQNGLRADMAWTESRAWTVSGSSVERNAEQSDIEFFWLRNVRQAHERGDAAGACVNQRVHRLGMRQLVFLGRDFHARVC